MQPKKLGTIGENAATAYLENKGYQILHKNYRCKYGEIDLITAKGETLCFVEVKTRQTDTYGRPCDSINSTKRRHMRTVAGHYMANCSPQDFRPKELQFDVVEIQINHIPNAF